MKDRIQYIKKYISKLDLDLSGTTVLTEAGSNDFLYNPLIPLFSGAKKVNIWIKDSVFGSAKKIESQLLELFNELSISKNMYVIYLNDRNPKCVEESDIITNSFMIRPLDRNILQYAKPGTVIPLMWEAWEVREDDIDLEYCAARDISVAGTNEKHESIHVFESAGYLAEKMLKESLINYHIKRVFVWSDDQFGEEISKYLDEQGIETCLSIDQSNLKSKDIVFITDYSEMRPYFKTKGLLDNIVTMNEKPKIVHLYGLVDLEFCEKNGIEVYPKKNGNAQKMTFTFNHLGYEPLFRLQIGSFKVAECMLTGEETSLTQYIT